MRKTIYFTIMSLAFISLIAYGSSTPTTEERITISTVAPSGNEVTSQGFGACKWSGCKCKKFVPGGASGGKCKTCGHQDFNHGLI